jgi:hypothetical protein
MISTGREKISRNILRISLRNLKQFPRNFLFLEQLHGFHIIIAPSCLLHCLEEFNEEKSCHGDPEGTSFSVLFRRITTGRDVCPEVSRNRCSAEMEMSSEAMALATVEMHAVDIEEMEVEEVEREELKSEEESRNDWRLNVMITFSDSETDPEEELEANEEEEGKENDTNVEGIGVPGFEGNEKIEIPSPLPAVENVRTVVDAEVQTITTEEEKEIIKINISTQTDEEEPKEVPIVHKSAPAGPGLEQDSFILEKKRQRYHGDPEDLNQDLFEQYGDEKTIEKVIQKRKLSLECLAERAARTRQAQWVRDHISLEQAIDELFSDHLMLHEKAHALRLHFEREKNLWSKAIQEKLENWKDDHEEVMIPQRGGGYRPQHSFGSSSKSFHDHDDNEKNENEENRRSMFRNLTPPMSPTLANWNKDQTEDEFEYFQSHPKSQNISEEDNISKDLPPVSFSNRYRFPSRMT